MADYTKLTDFAAKDSLLTGNPAKIITGTAHDNEYNAIAVAIATKVDEIGGTLTNGTLVTTALGTPSSGTLTNCIGLPVSTGISGLGTGVATFLVTPSSANLASAVTGETGSGALVFATSPALVTPDLGTPSALVGTNITGTAAGLTAGGNALLAGSTSQAFSTASLTTTGLFDISGASAGQIKFPASQNASANANTLDDYEEGTWTPSLGGNTTYNSNSGTYVKVGNTVIAHFVVDVNTLGTGSASTISGLPFQVNATTRGGGGIAFVSSPATAYASINPTAVANTTTLTFICASTAGAWTNSGTVFASASVISGTVIYGV